MRPLAAPLKRVAHHLLNAMGVEVRSLRNVRAARLAEKADRQLQSWRLLGAHQFATVLDIGANEGQFARVARSLWPEAFIHSFEPLPAVHASLVANFAGDPRFLAHNLALSDGGGTVAMNACAFSPSSSLLPMAQAHRDEWPESARHTRVDVDLERLDDWVRRVGSIEGPLLVKIDVQGFELRVIAGGEVTLKQADVLVLEVSFGEFYEGQPTFADIFDRMRSLGFAYRGNVEQYNSKDGSHVLYADAIFENQLKRRTE